MPNIAPKSLNLWGSPTPGNIKAKGKIIGNIRWKIHEGPTFQNFDAFPSGFEFYRRQIPTLIFPTAFLESIDVDKEHQRHGYASSALRIVLARAKKEGAKTAFLRVGFKSSEEMDYIQDRDWKILWYEREGFFRLANELPVNLVPYMWHPLVNIQLPIDGVTVARRRKQKSIWEFGTIAEPFDE